VGTRFDGPKPLRVYYPRRYFFRFVKARGTLYFTAVGRISGAHSGVLGFGRISVDGVWGFGVWALSATNSQWGTAAAFLLCWDLRRKSKSAGLYTI
jgi:hypothetical protein